jgi:hypothetical protein
MNQLSLDSVLAAALPAARRTLAELNATPHVSTWQDTFVLEHGWRVGSQSRRWSGSPKTHLLRVSKVTATGPNWKPGSYRVGSYFSVAAVCNSNGQHTGTVYERDDTDAITCEKCLKRLAEMGA